MSLGLTIIHVIQDFTSNLLDEKFIASWDKLQNEEEKTLSVDFVNKVSEYQMQKMKQTDSGKEPIQVIRNSENINVDMMKSMLYDVLMKEEPIAFPSSSQDNDKRRRKRDAEDEEEGNEEEEAPTKIVLTQNAFGDLNKREKVSFLGSSYKTMDRISPLWNAKTGNSTALVFLDSVIVTATCQPNASSSALEKEPLTITLKHKRKVKATGRRLLADKETEENGEIRRRDCMRWDPTLEFKGKRRKGGWTTDGCSMANSSAEESTCQCTQLGTYAIMSKIRQPFDIPPEPEWVTLSKWICSLISVILLLIYMFVILIRKALHEQYHIIRFNLSAAAVGGLVSFGLAPFFYDDEDTCRVLSVLTHFFYTAVGMWLMAEANALFAGLVNGSFGNHLTIYFMTGWVLPGCMIGGCFYVFHNYGYDYRCLVGPTAGRRWLLIGPILASGVLALVFSTLTCINYGTPAVKKTVIVNELSSATRANFIVILLFLTTWVCGVFALVDLGFDGGEIPAFNPIFQILNSCLGIFIVALIGVGSRHFRYCLCHSGKNNTLAKPMNLDPFDVHDKAKISKRKKIYLS